MFHNIRYTKLCGYHALLELGYPLHVKTKNSSLCPQFSKDVSQSSQAFTTDPEDLRLTNM